MISKTNTYDKPAQVYASIGENAITKNTIETFSQVVTETMTVIENKAIIKLVSDALKKKSGLSRE